MITVPVGTALAAGMSTAIPLFAVDAPPILHNTNRVVTVAVIVMALAAHPVAIKTSAAVLVPPAGPVGPAGPVAPVKPVVPVAPAGPLGPTAPVVPVAPAGPVGPVGPTSETPAGQDPAALGPNKVLLVVLI